MGNVSINRGLSLFIPFATALLFFGFLESIFGIDPTASVFSTGITMMQIFGALNVVLFILAFKHRIP